MANYFRTFFCANGGCSAPIEFNLLECRRNKRYIIVCPKCAKEWKVSFQGTTCCSLRYRFCSIEEAGKSIVKVKSFKKK